ncbi:hypothetical protein BC477_12150 [Clavibacter michiganensis subsp. michiganensis]|uniref:Uncharacterized protein n=1 Tax=Clavibacter michiganensis subsp. michiganensis TaxID=33013 RepID=A0A251XHA6_CLAMM|nr:hypothetical protein BC477_12150 [Clavibacter michiganensis subsp. michiganensis]OUE02548.1 hypothetical protein CMMCAS07_11060 [Clavibacter michiganensis subsp. michiganensis]
MQRILGGVRLVAAIVVVVALIGDFDYVQGFTTFAAENWFSYFTTQSGMAGVVVLAASGLQAIRGRAEPPLMAAVRAVVLSYVVVSGVVFGLIVLESSSQAYYVEVPWSSRLLHFVIPAYALLDWTLAPGRPRVTWKAVGWAMPSRSPGARSRSSAVRASAGTPTSSSTPRRSGSRSRSPRGWPSWRRAGGVSAFVVALSRVRPADGGPRGRRRGDDAQADDVAVADAPARATTDASPSTPRETAAAER